MIIRFLIIFIIIFFSNAAGIFVPEQDWQLEEILPRADGMIALRQGTTEKYLIWLGTGCMPALFDDPSSFVRIYSTQFTELSDTEHLGVMSIKTQFRDVQCKITRIQKL